MPLPWLLLFPTELFIVNTVVCDEVHTGMKHTSSKAKLCSWFYFVSIDFFSFHSHALEKEMATHSSVLAWRIPGTVEPGGLPSMGSHRVGHD